MANGTLSLVLKHRLAAWDMLRRSLPAAILLEDDAKMPTARPTLWDKLSQYTIPSDAVSPAGIYLALRVEAGV